MSNQRWYFLTSHIPTQFTKTDIENKNVKLMYLGPEGLQFCLEFGYFFFILNQLSLCLLPAEKLLVKLKRETLIQVNHTSTH